MGRARLLWLLLPAAALVEFASFVHDAHKAPKIQEWQALRAELAKLKRPADLVLVAPAWADPIARYAFGDALLPIADLARADDSTYTSAIEVSTLGESAPEVAAWKIREERQVGRFKIRVRDNPNPETVLFSFLERAHPPELEVGSGTGGREADASCGYRRRAPASAGGLHGHLAFPRERYECGGAEEFFVGITILDDQEYRPRRCVWADPKPGQRLRLTYKGVPVGRSINGYAGLSYFIYRDGRHAPVTLAVSVAGVAVGSYEHHEEWGWHAFRFDTARFAGQTAEVEFSISSDEPRGREFCFYADSR